MRDPLFLGLTPFQIGSIVLGLALVFGLVRFLLRILRSQAPGLYHARMKCRDCGWTGMAGKHIPKCARCGGANLRPA